MSFNIYYLAFYLDKWILTCNFLDNEELNSLISTLSPLTNGYWKV